MKTLLLLALLAGISSARVASGETLKLSAAPDQALCLAGVPQTVTVKIDLAAGPGTQRKRTPINLAVVVDRSGSMAGAKIEKARQAAMMAVDQMGPGDIFSLVVYDHQVEVLIPAQPVADKEKLKAIIERIRPGGSTALYAGVERGARELQVFLSPQRINRILLLSDGLANVGPSRPEQLRELGRRLAQDGVSVSTVGVGDDYNEDLMSGLAAASDANYYYVKDTEKLPEIFARELGSLLATAARDIRIEVVCPPGIRPLGFPGRPEKFTGQRAVVQWSSVAPGQNRHLLLQCRLEPGPAGAEREIAQIKINYRDEGNDSHAATLTESVRVAFTGDATAAQASANAAVICERELVLNAVKKDEAIAEADAGRLTSAASRMSAQAEWLAAQMAHAPADLRPQLDAEVQNLRRRSEELRQGQYGSGTRKALQSESWYQFNSKN